MNINLVPLAKKYAVAFLNVFGQTISYDDFEQICLLGDFFQNHKQALFFFGLPHIPMEEKIRSLVSVIERYSLPLSLKRLFILLIEDGRSLLLQEVMNQICEEYQQRHGLQTFSISSSHELTKEEREEIKKMLEHITNNKVRYTFTIDKKLIAGLRLQSSTVLWEYSIEKQLRNFARAVHE
jgi:F-type H+-transporting ATPase subunit delta